MAKSFMELGAVAPENRVLIVDTLNLGFRWKHQGRTDFAEDYIKTVESFASSYNCGTIIAAMDRGHSAYRKSLYPEYKADREERYKDQTEAEKIAFENFMNETNRGAKNLRVTKFWGFVMKWVIPIIIFIILEEGLYQIEVHAYANTVNTNFWVYINATSGGDGHAFRIRYDLADDAGASAAVSYTHLRAHETPEHRVCRLVL